MRDYPLNSLSNGLQAYADSAETLQNANIYELSSACVLMKTHPSCMTNADLKHQLESNIQIFSPYLENENM